MISKDKPVRYRMYKKLGASGQHTEVCQGQQDPVLIITMTHTNKQTHTHTHTHTHTDSYYTVHQRAALRATAAPITRTNVIIQVSLQTTSMIPQVKRSSVEKTTFIETAHHLLLSLDKPLFSILFAHFTKCSTRFPALYRTHFVAVNCQTSPWQAD